MPTRRQQAGLAASALGLVLLLLGGREAAELRRRLTPASLLVGAQTVARAQDGTLFVGSTLRRVHVYTAEGEPLRGFLVPEERFRLEVAPPDRLLLRPERGGAPLVYDFFGEPLEPPARIPDAQPAPRDLRIVSGDLVREGGEEPRVLVPGFESQREMLVTILAVGACLFTGGLLLVGGVLATGRRASA